MATLRNVLVLITTQSNGAGATCTDNGGAALAYVDPYMGITDPIYPNANTGGSAWPFLVGLGLKRGVRYHFLNCGVGGARADHFTGLIGATVVGSQTDPLTFHNMGTSSLSTTTGTVCVEGNAGFDPFGLLADSRAKRLEFPQFTECVALFENAESDGGTSAAQYQAALTSIANYHIGTGVTAVMLGLSASGNNSQANMDKLQGAKNAAIAAMQAAGKPVYPGADMYTTFGMTPPLYQSVPQVHYTLPGQGTHAERLNAALIAIGH